MAAESKTTGAGQSETMGFQAEVGRLLDIVANALYSEREIFLRELISNAADACDKLRYLAIETPELAAGDNDYAITVTADKVARTITIADNGVGMNRDDLVDNLGTIARSGTSAFVDRLTGDKKKDVSLIGQFGVGFYSAFMVADEVSVTARRAGEEEAWHWTSDGKSQFTIEPAEKATRGTRITLHLKEDADEFLERMRLERIIKTYSDHIPFPIRLAIAGDEKDEAESAEETPAQVNEGSALWTRPKSEIDDAQYSAFYKHVSHGFDEPWMTLHFRAEGVIEYTGLVFVPTERPFDLFNPERMSKVKLYVKRVFITEECDELLPSWLRFLRGVIDSEDLPLNISREMLQNNPVVAKIRSGLVKRVLGELAKKAEKEPETYTKFWENFGLVLKEGLYESAADRESLFPLTRFASTTADGLTSLDDYIARMKDGQKAIYYIAGDDADKLRKSPQIEGFAKKGVEVLLMTDPVDEFWIPACGEYKGHAFKSVTRAGADLSDIKADDAPDAEKDEDKAEESKDGAVEGLAIALKLKLGETVKEVRASDRLTNSAVCLVADESGMDIHLERMLRQHKQLDQASPRILELNPDHPLIKALASKAGADGTGDIGEAAELLYDQALIVEGEQPSDPSAFARRLSEVMAKAIG
ncbi:molecular chaperone HtpG [Marivibrio halodurans]|uniref:Chaperone protein HtpG n=1 Tax=Marivibrio halodurans TaxID=2039722 RepID=A0A8J7S349_9PROT|nr:molecular chaperone HtpG [Marivibrio halodurans]MBP5858970.1 molecular chaperone HtpG [Marivibrio halodurans]